MEAGMRWNDLLHVWMVRAGVRATSLSVKRQFLGVSLKKLGVGSQHKTGISAAEVFTGRPCQKSCPEVAVPAQHVANATDGT